MKRKVLYIAPALPALTCTFIYREVFDLRKLGFSVDTVSMNTPPRSSVSSEAEQLLETTTFLDRVSLVRKLFGLMLVAVTSPLRLLRCLRIYMAARPMKAPRDHVRLAYHLVEACFLMRAVGNSPPNHIHCHFVTGATSIGMFLSELLQVPFSFTMHASMIWIDPIALGTKLQKCRFCASISEYNRDFVCEQYGEQLRSKIHIVRCGIALDELEQEPPPGASRGGFRQILSVGQLMKRKGHHVSIEAASILRKELPDLRWTIVGEGNQRELLERLIAKYGLEGIVTLAGAQPHERIAEYLRDADAFVLPCVIGDDLTRDGIPVALMEAMAWGVPVISTDVVGVPELISDGVDGILVPSDDAPALADALRSLSQSPELVSQFSDAGYRKIEREFNSARSSEKLAQLFFGE